MIKTIIFIGVLGLIHASLINTSWDDYEDVYDFFDFKNNCTTAGLLCESCKNLVQCVETNGKFTTIQIEDCSLKTGFTCLKNQCTNATNPRCPIVPVPNFICENSGVFPDPFECTRYHICVKAEDAVDGKTLAPSSMKCNGNFGYDPVSTYCKTPLNSGACPDQPPIPECEYPGHSGPVSGTSIYFICLQVGQNLIPHLYMCPNGKVYTDSKCT